MYCCTTNFLTTLLLVVQTNIFNDDDYDALNNNNIQNIKNQKKQQHFCAPYITHFCSSFVKLPACLPADAAAWFIHTQLGFYSSHKPSQFNNINKTTEQSVERRAPCVLYTTHIWVENFMWVESSRIELSCETVNVGIFTSIDFFFAVAPVLLLLLLLLAAALPRNAIMVFRRRWLVCLCR